MTDERYREIDGQLDASGWNYNPESKDFESTEPDEDDNAMTVEWKELLGSLSGVSEEELREYVARRDRESNE